MNISLTNHHSIKWITMNGRKLSKVGYTFFIQC